MNPEGIGTVSQKANGCRGVIGPVPQPALDEKASIKLVKYYHDTK
jgi:hypothetical protein